MNWKPGSRHPLSGFTMVELLLVVVVVAVLATAAMAAAWKLRELAAERLEMGCYRRLGQGILGWAGDHSGRLPRSSHSAFANGELGWRREILPMLGHADKSAATYQRVAPEEFAVVGAGDAPRGPALNVYFELDPASDDYDGSPATWRQLAVIPNPAFDRFIGGRSGAPGRANGRPRHGTLSRRQSRHLPRASGRASRRGGFVGGWSCDRGKAGDPIRSSEGH